MFLNFKQVKVSCSHSPLYLLVGVLGLQALLFRLVPELGEPLEEQRVRAGRQDPFPTQPDRFRSWHPSGPDRCEITL